MKLNAVVILTAVSLATAAPLTPRSACRAKNQPATPVRGACKATRQPHAPAVHPIPVKGGNGDISLKDVGNGNGNNNGVLNNDINGNNIDISPSLSLGHSGKPAPKDGADKDAVNKDSGDKDENSGDKGEAPAPGAPKEQEKECPCAADKAHLELDGVGNSNGNQNGVLNGIANGNSIKFSPSISL
ncbi:hypothetical protein EYZ11_002255 [Aspergillus tanneri]|uniref:Superoxide dismutase copper/zinc binding domain-containing protein n=1 Tax=Aspergillus tanneri TaxID=1220188 RepID=A0A4S3JR60_9EURO|nr:uncharacterized protein ATNIH1004_001901 [Aspergillus tanneri]KAA8641436.1 hypothetical protein ATNIH1004_001901 [Aspergillus tanneri]THC98253.1 hypothetical protein EYZ11_002255 [Aspergillus tanneri]